MKRGNLPAQLTFVGSPMESMWTNTERRPQLLEQFHRRLSHLDDALVGLLHNKQIRGHIDMGNFLASSWISVLWRWDPSSSSTTRDDHMVNIALFGSLAFCSLFTCTAIVFCHSVFACIARDPVKMTLDALFAKSDAVVLAQVERFSRVSRYHDLGAGFFDEYAVTIVVRATLKGEVKRGANEVIIAYKSNGLGMPGNFGSTLRLFDQGDQGLHLLYLREER